MPHLQRVGQAPLQGLELCLSGPVTKSPPGRSVAGGILSPTTSLPWKSWKSFRPTPPDPPAATPGKAASRVYGCTRATTRATAALTVCDAVSVHGSMVTSVHRGTEVRVIAGAWALAWNGPKTGPMRSRRETTGQGRTPETLDHLVCSDERIPLQIKPQKTDKMTNVAHRC